MTQCGRNRVACNRLLDITAVTERGFSCPLASNPTLWESNLGTVCELTVIIATWQPHKGDILAMDAGLASAPSSTVVTRFRLHHSMPRGTRTGQEKYIFLQLLKSLSNGHIRASTKACRCIFWPGRPLTPLSISARINQSFISGPAAIKQLAHRSFGTEFFTFNFCTFYF